MALIRMRAGRTYHIVGNLMSWLNYTIVTNMVTLLDTLSRLGQIKHQNSCKPNVLFNKCIKPVYDHLVLKAMRGSLSS